MLTQLFGEMKEWNAPPSNLIEQVDDQYLRPDEDAVKNLQTITEKLEDFDLQGYLSLISFLVNAYYRTLRIHTLEQFQMSQDDVFKYILTEKLVFETRNLSQ